MREHTLLKGKLKRQAWNREKPRNFRNFYKQEVLISLLLINMQKITLGKYNCVITKRVLATKAN